MTQNSPGDTTAAPTPDGKAAQTAKNQRRNQRRRVLKEGKLIFGQGHSVVDCIIDNVSDGGAHIRITSSHGVPGDFYLVEANRGIIHKAEVAWRTTTGIGLKILGPLDDAAARESLLRKFRRS
jgi:PilZ domain